MIAVDSSVAIAAFGAWHTYNELATELLDQGAALPAHAMLETYSVLTAFPPPHRAAPGLVDTWLEDRFATILPSPPPLQQRDLIRKLASSGRAGGAVYDGLIALTAAHAGAETLVTMDARAVPIYELIGVAVRLLPDPSA